MRAKPPPLAIASATDTYLSIDCLAIYRLFGSLLYIWFFALPKSIGAFGPHPNKRALPLVLGIDKTLGREEKKPFELQIVMLLEKHI
jgi:hypothetical protein